MVGQRLSWVGLSVGDYVIKDLLGEGSFSWVFRAVHKDGRAVRAIKVAKPIEVVLEGGPTSCVPTRAFIDSEKSLQNVHPDTGQLLHLQGRKLLAVQDPGLIAIEELSPRLDQCYYRMPVVLGQTLRTYMSSGPVPIDVLLDVAITMDRLAESTFEYHGDLKPENIMITAQGITLLDPGYFGPIDVEKDGSKIAGVQCAVTSPNYYPNIVPDDLWAFGFIIWEIACRQQLLAKRATTKEFNKLQVDDDLWDSVLFEEQRNNFFFSAILGAKPPSELRPGMPLEVEQLVLQAVRLSISPEGKLQLCEGFDNFAELASALALLLSKNIRYI